MLPLILSKFTIGNQPDITQGYKNTRVSIVTFDQQASIVANYTNINSINDVTKVLNGLTVSNSQETNLFEYEPFFKLEFILVP